MDHDGIPVAFYELLGRECLEILYDILNDCWREEIMPDELELAELKTLYKKGDGEDPTSYRSIA